MKKAIRIIALISFMALIFIGIISSENKVLAADKNQVFNAFNVACESTQASVATQTKEVMFLYKITGFKVDLKQYADNDPLIGNPTGGINTFRAVIEYDSDVFELLEGVMGVDGKYNGVLASKTKDGKPSLQVQNGWNSLTFNPGKEDPNSSIRTAKIIMGNNGAVTTADNVLKVVMRVKATAPVGKATLKLKNIEVANTKVDLYVGSAEDSADGEISTEVNIVELIPDAVDADLENGFGGFLRILPNTTVEEFKAAAVAKYATISQFYSNDNKTLSNSDFLPTGAKAEDSDLRFTIIALGDLNADGRLSAVDYAQLQYLIIGTDIFEDKADADADFPDKDNGTKQNRNRRRAADIKWDSKLTATDVAQAKFQLVEISDPETAVWYGEGEKHCYPVKISKK